MVPSVFKKMMMMMMMMMMMPPKISSNPKKLERVKERLFPGAFSRSVVLLTLISYF